MNQRIEPNDDRIQWTGAISLETTEGWVRPWRIEYREKDLYHRDLVEKAAMPAGVTIEFVTDTSQIEILCNVDKERSPMDLFVDGVFHSSHPTSGRSQIKFDSLGPTKKTIQIWLPQFGVFNLTGLIIDEKACLNSPYLVDKIKWVTYGSSITQCRQAASPSLSWPSLVAVQNNLELTCLGYGGQCHLDPLIATTIGNIQADLITLCLGINIYGSSSLNERTFKPGIIAFIKLIRSQHEKTPILVMSPIYSPGREAVSNNVNFTLQQMRVEVRKSVETLRSKGDENVFYINGLDIFDESLSHLLPDNLHPNTEGYSIMAKKISEFIQPYI